MDKNSLLLVVVLFFATANAQNSQSKERLWYKEPATKWMEALPVGNGRLGAMIFGQPINERIQLNEDSMWPGGPDWGDSKGTPEDLVYIRQLLKEGQYHKADEEIVTRFSNKGVVRSHQTMGDLYIDFSTKKVANYYRELDIETAVATTSYNSEGYNYTQEVFASAPHNVLIIRYTTTNPKGMDATLRMNRPKDEGFNTVQVSSPAPNQIQMKGMVTQNGGRLNSEAKPLDYGVKFDTRLVVKNNGGIVVSKDGILELKNVNEAVLLLVGSTSFYHGNNYESYNEQLLGQVQELSYNEMLSAHVADYQSLYKRVTLDLGGNEFNKIPTDERLKKIKDGGTDKALSALLFQYGRYLLISSSRPGTNPANLQGIWNEHIRAPWNADYHLNVNLQMNYWPAEVTNLSECHSPLFDYTDRLINRGRITAKDQYGIHRGAVIHHTSDIWAPAWMHAERAYWGAWIHGGGWLAQHYWEHYSYTNDIDFLKNRAWPAMKALAEFYLDWLIYDQDSKTWVSSPETSPENSYMAPDGTPAAVSHGAAMGHQIIGEVFNNTLKAASILKINDDFVQEVKSKLKKYIQEWFWDPMAEF